MAKFIAKNNKSTFTKLFQFFLTKSLHPYMNFNIVNLFNVSTCKQIFKWKPSNIFGNRKTT